MAESALKIPKFKIMGDALKVYNKVNGVAQEGATTQAAMMDFLQNNNDILRCFVEMLWQEQKPVVVGQLVWSPSLPNGVIAKVTQAGTLGADEPIWPSIVGSTVESGSAVLKIVLWAPETLPADGGTAALANNAEKLGGQLPAYYATATQLAAKAALLSPDFMGVPTAPTAAAGTNTNQLATCEFVMKAISAISSQGKIVSYSLAQNGYCKWDIGLILQWRNNPGLWAIPFTEFVAGGITMTRTGWQASGEWNGDSGTISLTGYTASCATGNSVSSIGGSAIAIGI